MPKVPSPRKATSPAKIAQREGVGRSKERGEDKETKGKKKLEKKEREEKQGEERQRYAPLSSLGNQWLRSRYNTDGMIMKHGYIPPANASRKDPDPSQIRWTGRPLWGIGVSVDDASFMYCVDREHIQDLIGPSGWLNLHSVAVRALEIHGGLTRHNDLIIAQRKKDMDAIKRHMRINHVYDSEPRRQYSAELQDFLEDSGGGSITYGNGPCSNDHESSHAVLQYGPIWVRDEQGSWNIYLGHESYGHYIVLEEDASF